jgi:pimeloyl-ACP methyl ester carboxylesterase
MDVTSPDGAHLAVWRSGDGPPLVLVHGTTVSHTDWARVIPELSERFTVYAMDRRGSGDSGDGPEYSAARESEDVAAVVDSTGAPAFLVGHSWGGLHALEAALLTGNLRKLVVYEPPVRTGPDFHPADIVERLDAFMAAGKPGEVVATFLREIAGQDPRRVELQRRTPSWPPRVAAAHTVAREVRASHFYDFRPERFRAIRAPTLLLLGGDSPPKQVRATTMLADAIPNARLVRLPGQTHIAQHTAPRLFLDEVLRFLDG